ncbi:PEBP-like protein [Mycena maculata]|uniref:PEBP-like protein n=1 Tax=Mycena maculata TaxID=230809 RepID=A0AAD7HNJ5_9AGAR|nr:PEBP-like protein [Mycena maculata]
MYLPRLTSVLTLALAAVGQDVSTRAVEKAFFAANLPANLSIVFKPTALLEVAFPQATGPPIVLHAGIHVPRNGTAGPPTFHVVGDVGPGPFVVATVDPDAPTPQDPTSAQIRHFLGGNFFNHGSLLVNNTPAVSNFLQPTPPAGSPAHRYTFLLFHQSPEFATQMFVDSATSVANFNISLFASEVDLGNPIAGTFMLVAPEPTT